MLVIHDVYNGYTNIAEWTIPGTFLERDTQPDVTCELLCALPEDRLLPLG